jgi:hypothetical protein
LFLFLLIGILMWRNAAWVIRRCENVPELSWLASLCRMIQVGTVAYASGGAFLSLTYYDLYWHFIAIVVIARRIVEQHQAEALPVRKRTDRFGQVPLSPPETQTTRPGF